MSEHAIAVSGLRKHYGDLHAVDGLDLEIPMGEVFALLGPNGAGKSTTVEILEGFRKRTGGDVEVLGIDPQHAPKSWRRRVGIMLQSTSSATALTARESVAYAASLYPHPRDVDETLETVGLGEKAGARVATLSGGQQRRLDVALAIVGRPELVFLDEPTTGFDPEARRQFWSLIEALRGDGTTIVLTTHYLDEADRLADRIGIIAAGRLVALDTPSGLRSRAADARVTWIDDGTSHAEETSNPTAFLRELLANHEGEIEGLQVVHPSLEDVYLRLIDDASRDAAQREEASA